jgi:hypothetical protein
LEKTHCSGFFLFIKTVYHENKRLKKNIITNKGKTKNNRYLKYSTINIRL